MNKTVADLASRWLTRKPETLSDVEHKVLQSAIDRKAVSRNVNESVELHESTSDRLADGIARIGGSWRFILAFLAFLVVWTGLNAWLLGRDSFDPYPFIFLNLILSMLAAIQAPIIMMSQNRQAERDRIDAAHDYAVNLKAEIEIMALHEKLDEIRFQEIILLRDQLRELTEQVGRLAAPASGSAPAR
ncbi:DUF1003 domain-containing protein [Aminobacter anthyllidis]|uniref:DUF1003 domain-containing protein n=1 Tax=Aminobacter anthyllidis TaxID=1035067 RepID=UPI002459108F|nr:DUF1003 domain-containing protein [Aminobacter anthyllidis]MDH4984476.1 DUF1003 domain-containing protein [Aminobacter anthyllidis]